MKKLMLSFSFFTIFLLILAACNNEEDNEDSNENPTVEPEDDALTHVSPADFPAAFLAGSYEQIYGQLSEEFQAQISLEEFEVIGEEFNQGVESFELVSEMPLLGMTEYQWMNETGDKGIRSYWSEDEMIEGMQFIPISNFPENDNNSTENIYQMPITEEWFTFWGGTNELVNYHYPVESQRYSYDLLIREGDDSFGGEPTENESYFAFSKEVAAPLEGVIVSVENDITDNAPTVDTNTDAPLGNHVIIEHENNEFSFLAHFKQESIVVNEGDKVEAGEILGQAGNSGNSSEAHIHFHVADSADLEDSTSLRIKFENGEDPIRGETVTGF